MKPSSLSGAELDYAVAKALGWRVGILNTGEIVGTSSRIDLAWDELPPIPKFSSDWSEAGPIIERERIKLSIDVMGTWMAGIGDKWVSGCPTPLIAAMRAFVASKLGNEVET